jgi:alpha-glucosidase
MKNLLTISKMYVFCLILSIMQIRAENYQVFSPDKRIKLNIKADEKLSFSVFFDNNEIIAPSDIALTLSDGTVLGNQPKVIDIKKQTVDTIITPLIKLKSAEIEENFNELKLLFEGNFSLTCRVYDNGAAYCFETSFKDKIKIKSEEASFNFSPDDLVYFPQEESFISHNERLYKKLLLKEINPGDFCSLPTLITNQSGTNVLLTEANLEDYPGLWLGVNENHAFTGLLPAVALKEEAVNDRDIKVTERADYIAETKGTRSFPWRVMAIAAEDKDLITNQLVYLLSKPLQIKDPFWIKPGKVAWDWWNARNIYGVDFESGINTATYKYYIDFASKFGIDYVILDEGWYNIGDVLDVNPDMDVQEIIQYGKEKNVGIILWVIWKTLYEKLHEAFDQYEKWGAKGIKVDFMQRDDQEVVYYYWKIAKKAAEHKLLVDFHGSYKPAGLRRAYPNVITREGVQGMEHCKWAETETPEHNVTLPFIRMVPGPMDYTPGAMINAQKDNFRICFTRPMSIGTRCHQLAMYVIYESPLQMLADSPSNYLKEPECMEFLSVVPTVWDDTRVLHAKISEYIIIARKSGNDWYVGAMTDEDPREFNLDLSFLDADEYQMDSYSDGVNAHKYASDYKKQTTSIKQDQYVKIKLASGGGWAARIYKK